MNKEDFKKGIMALCLSIIGLIVGYALISIPFHFSDMLTQNQMRLAFVFEVLLYGIILLSFFRIKEIRAEKKKKEKKRKSRRKSKEIAYKNEIAQLKIHINDDFAA